MENIAWTKDDLEELSISSYKGYKIDWNKVNSLEDIKFILQTIHQNTIIYESIPQFESIKHFLKQE